MGILVVSCLVVDEFHVEKLKLLVSCCAMCLLMCCMYQVGIGWLRTWNVASWLC